MHATAVVLLVSAVVAALLLVCSQVVRRLPVPSAALFLLAAAAASNLVPGVQGRVPMNAVVELALVALVLILFDGGLKVGWHRFRSALVPAALLGIAGTAGTAAVVAVLAHLLLDFQWSLALVAGAALAPTDPAVMFSVLRGRPVRGRVEAALEAESGVNDPVAIALVMGVLVYGHRGQFVVVGLELAVQLVVGAAVGVAVGIALPWWLRRAEFGSEGLYGIAALVAAIGAYGTAALLGGSGFLAVFIVGVLLGAEHTPKKSEIERFTEALASFAEMAVFAGLGLTIDLGTLGDRLIWRDGIALAFVLTLVARPLVVLPLTAPLRLRRTERLFLAWAGLKGAVPILLAALASRSNYEAERLYGIVFIVVLFSVIVQGTSLQLLARNHLGTRPAALSGPAMGRSPKRLRSGEKDLNRLARRVLVGACERKEPHHEPQDPAEA